MHLVGFTPTTREGDAALRELSGTALERFQFGQRIAAGETMLVTDTDDETQSAPEARAVARARGFRSMVIAPLRRENVSIGMLSVTRRQPGQFSPHQIELLQTFADQAVIAIENVRLFNEIKQSLERQTATAEILRVISASPTDVQPVFDAIARSAQRLAHGFSAIVTRVVGDQLHLVALTTLDPSKDEALRSRYPMPVTETMAGEVVATKAAQVVGDTDTDPRLSDTARQRARTAAIAATSPSRCCAKGW